MHTCKVNGCGRPVYARGMCSVHYQRWLRRTPSEEREPIRRQSLVGLEFGRLKVLKRVGKNKWNDSLYLCECSCGKKTVVPGGKLKSGHTKSCGCYMRERASTKATTHGLTRGDKKPRLFAVWNGMRARCNNAHSIEYKDYGGRGIRICDEWDHDFKAFYDWAMSNGYDPNAPRGKCTLDRIDNNGNYEPSNCRFVGLDVQARNTRRNHLLTIAGKTQCVAAWIVELGISKSTFYQHLNNDPDGGQRYFIDRYCKQECMD